MYGIIFKLFRVPKIKDNRVSFIIDSGESFKGNLDYIKKEFEKRGDFEFRFFYKDKLSLDGFKKLAGSRYIFLNDNFFPMAFMKFNARKTPLSNFGMLRGHLKNSEGPLKSKAVKSFER